MTASDFTVLSALEQALDKAASYYQEDKEPPACLLWPDGTGEWRLAAEALRGRRQVLTLGTYDPATQTGPAIWIRTLVDLPQSDLPLVYLPGVSRDELRAEDVREEDVPDHLAPLIELQYRGTVFGRRDGKDWTVASFLNQQEQGLGVEVATSTRSVVAGHLEALLGRKVTELKQRAPLTQAVLNQLSYPDLSGELLRWLDEPATPLSAGLSAALENEFQIELSAGAGTVATQLAGRAGHLAEAWDRYVQAPQLYPGLRNQLDASGPPTGRSWTLAQAEVWPAINALAERQLEVSLSGLHGQAAAQVRDACYELEERHGARREFVWAKLGESPFAQALAPLAELAKLSTGTVTGETPQEQAAFYAAQGYQTDYLVLQVLACARTDSQRQVLAGVVRTPYLDWLERSNKAFHHAVQQHGPLPLPSSHQWAATPGLAVIFVDGLRYDLAAQLAQHLAHEQVQLDWQFSTLPTITKTAKPAVAPVSVALQPLDPEQLTLTLQGKTQTAAVLREQLGQRGFVPTGSPSSLPDPAGAVWLEMGDFDSMGHSQGLRLASRMADELAILRESIVELLARGFREVRVITDHGWLLMPGGLPKVELPGSLAALKKGRCAVLKEGNTSEYATQPWSWDAATAITLAPGITSFEAGETYSHGGLSLQESVIPVLTVQRGQTALQVEFASVRWVNNRCKLEVTGGEGLTVDLRRKAADPQSSLLTAPKAVGKDGQVSLLVPADDVLGDAAILVALQGEQVVRQQTVIVGGDE